MIAPLDRNAVALMLTTLSGTVMDARLEQPLKARAPIDVTVLGIDTDAIDVQLAKAYPLILTTPTGIVTEERAPSA